MTTEPNTESPNPSGPQEAKPLMQWSPLDGNPAISEANPKEGLRYFIVDGGEYWAACISEGTAYKRIKTLTDTCGTANEARRICEQHWAYSDDL